MSTPIPPSQSRRCGWGSAPALLVVDMTRSPADASVPGHVPVGPPTAAACARLLDAVRRAALPVAFSRGGKHWHTSSAAPLSDAERGAWMHKTGLRDESPERAALAMEIVPALAPGDGELLVTKHRPSAFFGSPLAESLHALGVDTLVVAGMMTSGCVRATVTDAFSYDLRVIVPAEAVADRNPAAHEANLYDIDAKYGDVAPLDEVLGVLGSLAPVTAPSAR